MNWLYTALSLITVTVNTSVSSPQLLNPDNYDLATCSGVFVSPSEILTAGHCVKHSRGHQWIKTDEGISYAVTIERTDFIKDLALLKVTKPLNHKYAVLGEPIKITESVFTVNSGQGYDHTFNSGIVNNLIIEEETDILTILHNAQIMPGASGSGLFNAKGELVGINVAMLKTFSEAVDIYEIKSFLRKR